MKNKRKVIRGHGGSGNDAAVEDPNTLRSSAFMRLVDLVCEGEIEGLVDGDKSIFLNEVPIRNENGTLNFPSGNYDYDQRTGTQDQSYLEGFSAIESEVGLSQELRATTAGDIVREVSNPDVDRVRVRFQIPQLTAIDQETGDTHGSSVSVAVYTKPSGGSYSLAGQKTISGKCTSTYQFSLTIPLSGGDFPYQVKMIRTTADATSAYIQNKVYIESITEIIDAKLRYPNSAIVGILVDAHAFDRVPSRYYDMKLLKIKVPSNYDPVTRVYDGPWDGTFQTLWSDNPAWVFYDLCTSDRYGLGSFVPEDQIDKWGLYEVAQYCDGLVDDGLGGMEPRFTCNMLIQDRSEAYTVLQSLASVFRGMIFWSAGSVTVSQDAPRDATMLYTTANVADGRFVYQGASAKVRHTVCLVTWNDPEDFYRPKVEYIEDQDGIERYGIQQSEIYAIGCTSRGQAHRLGRWLLYTEQNESETVQFKTGLDGLVARPGTIIQIADPARAGARMGGRIAQGSTTDIINVDQIVDGAVSGFSLSIVLPDGTIETSTAIGSNGNAISVQPAFSVAPSAQSIWILQSDEIEAQTFRVVTITEESGGQFVVTAIKHDPAKFDAVEQNLILEPRSYSALTDQPETPTNLLITESLYQSGSDVRAKITVSWDRVNLAKSYLVKYKREDDNWVEMPESAQNDQDILNITPGNYQFEVFALNSFGRPSVVATIQSEAFGKLLPPSDVSNFSLVPLEGQAYLTWDQATDLDVLVGGQIRIRHSPNTEDQEWKNAVDILPAISGTATSAFSPLLPGTYMAKFVDSTGHYSLAEAIIVTTVPYIDALNIVHTQTEDPDFPGVKDGMTIITSENALVLESGALVDDFILIDDIIDWDFSGEIESEGTYYFEETFDLGGVWPSRILSRIDLEAFDIGNVIDSRITNIDTWEDIDGALINDVNAVLYVRTTEDDPAGSPVWTDWKRINAGSYSARAFQFKLVATSGSDTHNLYIRGLEITIDMADRTIHAGPIASGVGATYRVDFSESFYAQPALGITAENMVSGDFYTITNSDKDGFDIVFKNTGGTIVSKNFNYIAKGYGRNVA